MRIGGIADRPANPVISASDLEEILKRRKEAEMSANKDEAMQKVEEAKSENTKSALQIMDRHHEIVKKSQELNKAQAKKRALERMARERVEEHREVLAEMAINNAERRDLIEALRLKEQA
jgi:hypothetical protein